MSFASDKLYKGYLRRNMPTIASKVKVREIVPHLPCLTDHDKENIEAKREMYGNYDSMMLLLDCLKRRENWPEQFITALEACDHPTLAAEIRAEYDTLRGTNNSNPSSPSTTVIRAHVHPAPSASHLPIPESGANSQAAVALPAEASAPPEPAAQASPPLPPQAPHSPAAQVPEAVSPPEPVAEPPQSIPAPSTPPPSPDTPHTEATATPPPQREVNSHHEPEENSESDIQDISGDTGVIPDQVSAEDGEVSINSVDTPQPSGPVEQCETDTPSLPDPLQTTTTTEVTPPRSPSPTQINSDVTDGSSVVAMTPEKPPVQDTTPPVDIQPAAVLQPEENSEPPATQVVERSPQIETAATTSPLPGAAAPVFDDNSMCLSKPGQLVSIQPQNHDSPTLPSPCSPAEPYSGNSERLEISEAAPDAVTSAHIPACSAVSSVSALPCQENGITLNHNEPEENHYESPCESLESVRENVMHISEEPSILNLAGQSSTPQAQIVNGEAAKEITSAPPLSTNASDTISSVSNPSSENHHPSEPAPEPKTLQDSEAKTSSHTLPANTKYILTAGVGACALLMLWKFKK